MTIPTAEEVFLHMMTERPCKQIDILDEWRKDIEQRQRERCAEAYRNVSDHLTGWWNVQAEEAILSAEEE